VGQGDEYTDLYLEYLPRILTYMRLRVEGEELAQDLTAEVFERAVSRQHTLRRKEAFAAWIFRIARNTMAGYYRGRRSTLSLEAVSHQSFAGPSPPEVLIQQEEREQLRQAMASLSAREQEIIRLKFAGELGNQEIGRLLRLRPGHVAVILYRALRSLRTLLQEEI
jgi:RNA polymerase sigma factor (sigma-70 family)